MNKWQNLLPKKEFVLVKKNVNILIVEWLIFIPLLIILLLPLPIRLEMFYHGQAPDIWDLKVPEKVLLLRPEWLLKKRPKLQWIMA